MGGRVDWHGDAFKRELIGGVRKNLSAASIYLASQTKADISQAGTLRYQVPTKSKKAKKGFKQKTIYNFTHSKPGNPPFKQTGRLRASIAWELAGTPMRPVGRVGTNVVYGRYLELGTKRMAARPYLRANLRKWQGPIASIVTRKITRGGLAAIRSNQQRSGILGAGARRAGF